MELNKKMIILLITCAVSSIMFCSCGNSGAKTDNATADTIAVASIVLDTTNEVSVKDPLTYDRGVVINGVKWATRNVGKKGAFVANPEEYGNLYTWLEASSACPEGWRLPTREELKMLGDEEEYQGSDPDVGAIYELISKAKVLSKWTTLNGKNGRKFGNDSIGIFLPAAGLRYDGELSDIGTHGHYWSKGSYDNNGLPLGSFPLTINRNKAVVRFQEYYYQISYSIRCVAK